MFVGCNQGQPGKDQGPSGKDVSLVTGDNQQVLNVPSSSHLSVHTDDSNFLEPVDMGGQASVQPDKHRRRDAW